MIRWLLPFLAVAGLLFAGWSSTHPAGPAVNAPPPPPPAAFAERIAATGLVEASSENLALSADLPETIRQVLVHVGDVVVAGAPLVRLDDREVNAAVAAAQARLAAAEARLAELKALPRAEDLPPAKAKVDRAKAILAEAEDRVLRGISAAKDKAISEEELAHRRFTAATAAAELAQVEAEHAKLLAGAWAPQLLSATADAAAASGDLAKANAILARYTVTAPIAGTILQCNARPGERTDPGKRTLVVLGDCRELRIRAQVDERDAGRLRPGTSAMAIPRGEPTRRIPMTFVRIEPLVVPKRSLTGDSTERVDTRILEVVFSAEGESGLYVGQQVDVEIEAGVAKP